MMHCQLCLHALQPRFLSAAGNKEDNCGVHVKTQCTLELYAGTLKQ